MLENILKSILYCFIFQYGSSPLHEAVRQGDVDTAEYLLAAGADVYSEDLVIDEHLTPS